jgi:hypothetical protein
MGTFAIVFGQHPQVPSSEESSLVEETERTKRIERG